MISWLSKPNLSPSLTALLDAVMSMLVRWLSKPWTPGVLVDWKVAMGFTLVISSEPWFSEVIVILKFMTLLVVLHPSECDRASFLVIMQGLPLALTVAAHSGSWEALHICVFLFILLFAMKTETTFLGRLEPTRKNLPDSIFL